MGRANQVGIGLNPVDGDGRSQQKVAPTGPAAFLPLSSAGIEATLAQLEHVAMEGDRFPSRTKRGGRAYAGPLEGGVRPVSTGIIFTMAWGEPVSSTPLGAAFAATTALASGASVHAVSPEAVPYLFKVTTGGTTGGSEPTWPTTLGATVTSGGVTFTNVGPLPYKHTWNPRASGKRPMPATIWTIQNDIYEETGVSADRVVDEYIGAFLSEFAFNLEGNDYLLFTSAVQALRNLEDVTAPVATLDQTEMWSFDEVAAELSVPSISSGAYVALPIYAWGMGYNNGLSGADRFPVGSKEAVKIRAGNVESTVSFTAADNLESHYRRAIADRPELCKVKLTAQGRQLFDGTTDIYESLVVTLSGVEYTSGGRPMTAEDTWEDVEVEANVVKDGANYMLIELTNEHDGSDYLAPTP